MAGATVAIAVAALGPTATLGYFVIYRVLPIEREADIYRVYAYLPAAPTRPGPVSHADIARWNAVAGPWQRLAGARSEAVDASYIGKSFRVEALAVTAHYFSVVQPRVILGQGKTAYFDRPLLPNQCMLSLSLAARLGDSSDSGIGKIVDVAGRPLQVIGLLSKDFELLQPGVAVIRLADDVAASQEPDGLYLWDAYLRASPGTSLQELTAVLQANQRETTGSPPDDRRIAAVPLRKTLVDPHVRQAIIAGQAFVLVVGLCAVVNLAILLFAAALNHVDDLRIHHQLGASAVSLIARSFLTGALLGGAGGVVGAILCLWLTTYMASFEGWMMVPTTSVARLAAGVAAGASIPVGVVAAVPSAILVSLLTSTPWRRWAETGKRARSSRLARIAAHLVVGAEAAIAVVVVAASGVLLGDYRRLAKADLGFDPTRVFAAEARLSETADKDADRGGLTERYRQLVDAIRGGGFAEAALASDLPIPNPGHTVSLRIQGGPTYLNGGAQRALTPGLHWVSPEYFRTLGIPIRAGRGFSDQDNALEVVVVDETLARMHLQGTQAVGRYIRFARTDRWRQIIGVCGRARYGTASAGFKPEAYVPLAGVPRHEVYVLARGNASARLLERTSQSVVGVSIASPALLAASVERTYSATRFAAVVLTCLAAVSTILVLAGVHALLRSAIVLRRRELGIRLAVGASPFRAWVAVAQRTVFVVCAFGLASGPVWLFLVPFLRQLLSEPNAVLGRSWLLALTVVLVIPMLTYLRPLVSLASAEPATLLRDAQ